MRGLLRLLWLVALVLAAPLMAQTIMERLITPGPLSSAHARLESNCESCHSSFRKEAQNGRCTACHTGVGADIQGRTRYHGKFAAARSGSCKSCHSEHKGRGYDLTRIDPAKFDHGLTEFPLAGAHRQVRCTQCHGTSGKYRGVGRTCASCHKGDDPHRGQLGSECQSCHEVAAWKPARPFDHARTDFALTGAHRQQACLACHAGQRWKGLSAGCVSCHRDDDAHRGSRGSDCAGCHSTTSWNAVSFDHASTGFPLIGAHAAASCTGCHGRGNATPRPAQECLACHAGDDAHQGALGKDCAGCHDSRDWTRVRFDHATTEFALRGAHRTASCAACHQPKMALVQPTTGCVACHADDDKHQGGNGENCARCHGETDWAKVDFDHDRMTDFPLAGAHAKAECEACHVKPPDEVKLTGECASCHQADDTHQGQLGSNCARCHGVESWTAGVRFDHDLSRFPLLGAHAPLECAACHDDRRYKAKGIGCADCHADEHHQGTLGSPAACRDCHTTADWKAWSFDHDRATSFALKGAHQGLICSACHVRPGDPGALGTACVACHRRDDVHRGEFGEDCARCHVTDAFDRIIMPEGRN